MYNNTERGYIAYEYKTMSVGRGLAPFWEDSMRSFGWIPIDGKDSGVPFTDAVKASTDAPVELKFKRDRRIGFRGEINFLQQKCEGSLKAIETLEKSKTTMAMAKSLTAGLVGLALLAVSVFGLTFAGSVVLCVIFGVLGFAVSGLGFYLNGSVKAKRTREVAPLIDEQYQTVYSCCEQASVLLS